MCEGRTGIARVGRRSFENDTDDLHLVILYVT